MRIRQKLHTILERSDRADTLSRCIELFLVVLISVNVICVILETVDSIYIRFANTFVFVEIVSVVAFSVEYLLRIWCCVENAPNEPAWTQRARYAASPLAIIDLLAIAPFYLSFIFAIDLRFLRVLRLLRIFKLTRYSSAMTMLLDVFRQEASAFFAGFFILMVLLILTASGAYLVEQDAQPGKFGSIPDAMWWATATLTTVGYGDVTPITPLGKFFGACVTVIGIGMAALPAGILASGLADQLRRKREQLSEQYQQALEDGIIDADEERELEELRKTLGLSKQLAAEVLSNMAAHRSKAQIRHCPYCGGDLSQHH